MTRNGKIARLPYDIREELNRRLRDGKFGPALLKWLNEKPECQDVLDEEFDGRPITKQNLSEWKLGGYKEWVRNEEVRLQAQCLAEQAQALEKGADGLNVADSLATVLTMRLVAASEQLESIKDPKEQWAQLKEILRELDRLRREDHHARRLRLMEEQWEARSQRDEEEYERQQEQAKIKQELDMFQSIHNQQFLAEKLGGGEYGAQWAEWQTLVRHGLPLNKWEKKYYPKDGNAKPSDDQPELAGVEGVVAKTKESGPVQTGPTESSQKSSLVSRGQRVEGRGSGDEGDEGDEGAQSHRRDARAIKVSGERSKSKPVRPGQTASNQKSESVAPGPTQSKSVTEEATEGNGTAIEKQDHADQPSPQSFDAPRKIGAPMTQAAGSGIEGVGSMGDLAEAGTARPSESENEDEDERGASGQ